MSEIYLTNNEDLNGSLTELEKLHLANKFANQVLERKQIFSFPLSRNNKPEAPTVQESNGMQSTEPSEEHPHDVWGASTFLNSDRFQFVKNYLDRTERLLHFDEQHKQLIRPSSYEAVHSTDDLLKPTLTPISETEICDSNPEGGNYAQNCQMESNPKQDAITKNQNVSPETTINIAASSSRDFSLNPLFCESSVDNDTTSTDKFNLPSTANHDGLSQSMKSLSGDIDVTVENLAFKLGSSTDEMLKTIFEADSESLAESNTSFDTLTKSDLSSELLHSGKSTLDKEDPININKDQIYFENHSPEINREPENFGSPEAFKDVVRKTNINATVETPGQSFLAHQPMSFERLKLTNEKEAFSSVKSVDYENDQKYVAHTAEKVELCVEVNDPFVTHDTVLHTHRGTVENEETIDVFTNAKVRPKDTSYQKAQPVYCWSTESSQLKSPRNMNVSYPNLQLSHFDCSVCSANPDLKCLTLSNAEIIKHNSTKASSDVILPPVNTAQFEKRIDKDVSSGTPLLNLLMQSTSSSAFLDQRNETENYVNKTILDSENDKKYTAANQVNDKLQVSFGMVESPFTKKDINIPKLKLEMSEKVPKPPPSKIRPVRPKSAGSIRTKQIQRTYEFTNTSPQADADQSKRNTDKSPSKRKQRPSSAGKVAELQKSTSPKRVWKKSSIAWSSYGKRELKTWSSVNLSKEPTPPKTEKQERKMVSRTTPLLKNGLSKSLSNSVGLFSDNKPFSSFSQFYNAITLSEFPDEIILLIFSYLSFSDLEKVSKVNQRFAQIANDFILWQNVRANDVKLSDGWLAKMGQRNPKSLVLTNCCGNSVTNQGLRNFFKNCKSRLQSLHVSRCTGQQMGGDSILLHASCHCRCLKRVIMPWSSTTNNGLSAICMSSKGLEEININGNSSISDETFKLIYEKHGKTLQALEISGCFSISSNSLCQLSKISSNLKRLNVGLCSKVTNDCLTFVTSRLHLLEHLDLHGVKTLTNQCLLGIVTNCKHLTTLILANCQSISDQGVLSVAEHSPNLVHFNVAGCAKVSDSGIAEFLLVAKAIRHLDVSSTSVTKVGVDMVSRYCSDRLVTLKLSFCKNISQSCLLTLLAKCQSLTSLHIYGCKRINFPALLKANKNVCIEK